MNPKHLHVRMDRHTGDLYLTEEKMNKPIRRVKNITAPVFGALAAELFNDPELKPWEREIGFSDGTKARITVEYIGDEAPPNPTE